MTSKNESYTNSTSSQLNSLGVGYESAGNLNKATKFYQQAILKKPDNCVAYANLGNVLFKKGEILTAKKAFKTSLDICPSYAPSLNNLGNIELKAGRLVVAKKMLLKAIDSSKDNREKAVIYRSLATLYKKKDNNEKFKHYQQLAKKSETTYILKDVPFFQQKPNQCGVSALASAYNFYGLDQTPEEIASRVYEKEKKGSLNLKMLIDAKKQGLDAFLISGSMSYLKNELRRGNLSLLMIRPILGENHFVVLVGFEGDDVVIVHDGEEPFARYNNKSFLKDWQETGFSTIVVRNKLKNN
ncbi:MAG: tetratricopeptide repeat protein [Magnetococcales bacterium]|nr:tetratricopeptide repeat protein [Magnetococcales bacterium]